jgi:hypothetical protein
MATVTPEQIMEDIGTLPRTELDRLCRILVADLPRLTGGNFEVRPGGEKRAKPTFFKAARLVSGAVMLATKYQADAQAARAEADAARAKEERRRRPPTELTTKVRARVAELVDEYHEQRKRASWTDIANRIRAEFGKVYSPDGLRAMHYRKPAARRLTGDR